MAVGETAGLATRVDDELALEQRVEVLRLLALHDTHLGGLATVLVVRLLGEESGCGFFILSTRNKHTGSRSTRCCHQQERLTTLPASCDDLAKSR